MSRLKSSCRLARVVLPVAGACFILMAATSRGTSYLTTIGPPNLRFAPSPERGTIVPTLYSFADSRPVKIEVAVAKPADKPAVKPADKPVAQPEPQPKAAAPEIVISPPATNATEVTTSSDAAPPVPPPLGDMGANPMPGTAGTTIVTPEMLLNFFKPVPGGTGNAAQTTVLVPGNLGFIPPVPTTDHSSRAVYKKE